MQRAASPIVVLLVAGLLAASSGLAACGGPEAHPVASPDVWRGEGALVEVQVHDLHCDGCQRTAEKQIATVVGVAQVTADHESDVIRIQLTDPAIRAEAIDRLRDRIHDQGWKVVGEDPVPDTD